MATSYSSGGSQNTNQSQSTSTPVAVQTPQSQFSLDVAQMEADVAGQLYNWANGVFQNTSAITDQTVQNFFQASQQALALAGNNLQRYTQIFQPLEDQLVNLAQTYSSNARVQFNMGQAEAGAEQAGNQARLNAEDNLRSFGIDPSSGRYAELEQAGQVATAANAAGQANLARQATEQTGRNLLSEAVQVGQQYPGQIVNSLNAANSSLQGAENATLANANTGANLYNTGTQALATVGNTLKQPLQGQQAQSTSQGQGTSNQRSASNSPSQGGNRNQNQPRQPNYGGGGGQGGGGPGIATPRGGTNAFNPAPGAAANNRNNQNQNGYVYTNPYSAAAAAIPQTYTPSGDVGPYASGTLFSAFNPVAGGGNAPNQGPYNSGQFFGAFGGGNNLPTDNNLSASDFGNFSQPDTSAFPPINTAPAAAGQTYNGTAPVSPSTVGDLFGVGTANATDSGSPLQPLQGPDTSGNNYGAYTPQAPVSNYTPTAPQESNYTPTPPPTSNYTPQQTYTPQQQTYTPQQQTYTPQQPFSSYGGGYSGGGGGGGGGYYSQGGSVGRLYQPAFTTGGQVPRAASPSMGRRTDDVNAKLNAGEFVVPKDVAAWKGHEFFQNLIDKSRKARATASAHGKPTQAPSGPARFASRPMR